MPVPSTVLQKGSFPRQRSKDTKNMRKIRCRMATKKEIEKHLKIALEEIGKVKP